DYYANDGYGLSRNGAPHNDAGLVQDAVAAADGDVDFSKYDRDGDGYVDYVMVAHVGSGAEARSGDRTQLWSINSSLNAGWNHVIPYETADFRPGSLAQHMKVDRFSIVPERSPIDPDSLTEIGVYCHEFGHGLGWPDLYDVSYLGGQSRFGPGDWCLMSTGEFGGDSRSPELPSRPCAWALMDAGWIDVENLSSSGSRRFSPVAEPGGHAYRLWWQG